MIAKEFCISAGAGSSKNGLPSFDKALLVAGVGNYNLVRLSSILPAGCREVNVRDLPNLLKEGSLLPTAYATITSNKKGDRLISCIGVGIPADSEHVGVIMEYSAKNISVAEALATLESMITEAFEIRGWELHHMLNEYSEITVEEEGVNYTTFACIAEW